MFNEFYKCSLCKSQETSKWFFNSEDDVTYCAMCYHLAKKNSNLAEKEIFEVVNSQLFYSDDYSDSSEIEDDVYEIIQK
ncbi:unnamed protein product [Auanema sp. JU1783]|nr:unnamed protein product [Auanema sp. JU1783]